MFGFLAAGLALCLAVDLAALPADRATSQYVRRAWTVESGLPHSTVRGFTQTSNGYLWFATYEGLVRFNGDELHLIDRTSNPNMLSTSIVTLCRTKDDVLWLGTLSGLMRYYDGEFRTIAVERGPHIAQAVAASDDGTVWMGTAAGELIRVVKGRAEVMPLALPKRPIEALVVSGNTIWIGTSHGLIRYRNGALRSWTTATGLSSDSIGALLADRDGALMIGTAAGLDRMQGETIEHVAGIADQVTALQRDRDGNLWVGTYSTGLFRVAGESIASYGTGDGLLNPTVRSIFEDDEGSLWIGTNGGVEQLRVGDFINWRERGGLTDAVTRVIFEDRDGIRWVGTAKGLYRSTNGRFQAADELSQITGVLSIAQSRDGAHWFGTSNGVYRVFGDSTTRFTTANGLSHNTVRAIHEDRRGDVWLLTDFGVNRIRANGRLESLAGREGLGTDYAVAIDETAAGRIWIATGGGLAEFDGRAFKLHSAPGALPSSSLLALEADDDGTVWIATGGDGLLRYRNGKAKAITTREGLPSDKILSIVDDGEGRLWFGTVRGAFFAGKNELNAVADGTSRRLVIQLFDENDGLGSRQCNGVANPAALRTRDGRIWFATANGVSALINGGVLALPRRNPVIEAVSLDGKTVETERLRSVPPGVGRIEFAFTGMTLVTPERLHFRYWLKGYEDHWIDAGTNRAASYTNLSAGDYQFLLASSRDGVSWQTTEVSFSLEPHVYQTRWFMALTVLGIAALLFSLHNYRLHLSQKRARLLQSLVDDRTRQISEEKERTELALQAAEAATRDAEASRGEAERHEQLTERALVHAEEANRAKSIFLAATSHELRTPLNAIIGFSDILITQVSERLEPRHSRFLENIHSSGQYLLGIINNILDLSKVEAGKMDLQPEAIILAEVTSGISAVMKGVSALRRIAVELDVPDDLPILEADQTLIKQILYNLISNAVKFSPEGSRVIVAARPLSPVESSLRENSIEIRVTDEGIGIDPKDHQLIFQEFRQAPGSRGERPHGTGLGLALVKRFVDMHRGTIRVESETGRGSTFVVVLPCKHRSAKVNHDSVSEKELHRP